MTGANRIRNFKSPPWSDEQIAMLRALWGLAPARDIAKAIGKSGNAVIGKANRMGLPPVEPEVWVKWVKRDERANRPRLRVTTFVKEETGNAG